MPTSRPGLPWWGLVFTAYLRSVGGGSEVRARWWAAGAIAAVPLGVLGALVVVRWWKPEPIMGSALITVLTIVVTAFALPLFTAVTVVSGRGIGIGALRAVLSQPVSARVAVATIYAPPFVLLGAGSLLVLAPMAGYLMHVSGYGLLHAVAVCVLSAVTGGALGCGAAFAARRLLASWPRGAMAGILTTIVLAIAALVPQVLVLRAALVSGEIRDAGLALVPGLPSLVGLALFPTAGKVAVALVVAAGLLALLWVMTRSSRVVPSATDQPPRAAVRWSARGRGAGLSLQWLLAVREPRIKAWLVAAVASSTVFGVMAARLQASSSFASFVDNAVLVVAALSSYPSLLARAADKVPISRVVAMGADPMHVTLHRQGATLLLGLATAAPLGLVLVAVGSGGTHAIALVLLCVACASAAHLVGTIWPLPPGDSAREFAASFAAIVPVWMVGAALAQSSRQPSLATVSAALAAGALALTLCVPFVERRRAAGLSLFTSRLAGR